MLKPVALLTPRPSPPRDSAVPDWLLASKLEPPLPRPGAVVRSTLLAALDQAQARPLTLLLAPPGFGKTTLLAQWHAQLRARDHAVAWLSLDEEDTDAARFLGHLALALQHAGADPALCAAVLHNRDQDPREAVTVLLRALRTAPRRISMILDDYDRLGSGIVDELVLRLVEHGGGRLHLLLATRRVPALRRWRGWTCRRSSAVSAARSWHWMSPKRKRCWAPRCRRRSWTNCCATPKAGRWRCIWRACGWKAVRSVNRRWPRASPAAARRSPRI